MGNEELYTTTELHDEARASLLAAFAVEPRAGLDSAILYSVRRTAAKRRMKLARLTMIVSALGFASPLALVFVAFGRSVLYLAWQLGSSLQTGMIGAPLQAPGADSAAAFIISALLVGAAGAFTLSATRLARTGG
ncbi:MAG: hypothetical protein ACYCVB_03270 [Bacilli bacterium]